jgi:hypothetical protein
MKGIEKNSFSMDDVLDYVKKRRILKKDKKSIKKDLKRIKEGKS